MWYSNLEKNIYFSTYSPPTLIHFSHRFTTASKPAAWKSFHSCLSHFRTSVSNSSRHQRNICHSAVNCFKQQTPPNVNRKHFFMNTLCIESFCPQKCTTELCSSVVYTHARSLFRLLKPASEYAHARLLPRLSWSWTPLLAIDTNRNPNKSITAVYFHPCPIYWLFLVFPSGEFFRNFLSCSANSRTAA
jgi:hypothetical protein